MGTYVLVHGAWHGGWCWRAVAGQRRAAGHQVWTPTLSGLGEREHLGGRQTTLRTHIDDVAKLLEFEDLWDVSLVGHSYAGFVVTGVLPQAAARIRNLVYLDASLPWKDGLSAAEASMGAVAALPGFDQPLVPVPPPPLGDFGVTDTADLAWLHARLRPHPRRTFTDRLPLPARIEDYELRRHYIVATGWGQTPFLPVAERLAGSSAWTVSEIAAGHDVMVTCPAEVAGLLERLAP